MATRNEKLVRLELPSTSGVEVEIRESNDRYILNFFQNDRQINSSSISSPKLDQDRVVDLLSEAGIEFFSFSAIFDIADLLVNTIKDEFQAFSIDEEADSTPVTQDTDNVTERFGIITEDIPERKDAIAEDIVSIKSSKILTIPPGDKELKRIKMLHSKSGFATIYYTPKGKFAVVLSRDEELLQRKVYSKDNVNQDKIVELISESGIDFLSFSAIYDSAEQIESLILKPETLESEDTVSIPQMDKIVDVDDPTALSQKTPSQEQDEVTLVDLSEFDMSKFSKAEDFDKFITKVKEVVEVGQPLPVKELEIAHSGGVDCIILRKFDSWFLRFRKSDGSISAPTEIAIDQDEIARVINQEIPKISFSYLYDASELIYNTIQDLATKPMDQIIINVAVGHFLQIIEQNEAEGNLKAASKITEVLLRRFRKENNSKGILRFGRKLVKFLVDQGKDSKVVKTQSDLISDLLKIDVDTSIEFVFESIEMLADQNKHLNAANLCDLVLEHYLSEKIIPDSLSTILLLAKKQAEFYKHARLPVVMWENALRYAHFALKEIGESGDTLSNEQKEGHIDDIVFLVDSALGVQEERKANFEILSTLEETSRLLKEINEKTHYQRYINRLILTLETQGKKEKALEITLEAAKALMGSDTYVKSCELSNQAIKLYYELNKVEEAVDFSLGVVRGLTELNESEAAKNYLQFVEDLIGKAYKDDDSRRIEKQLAMGDLLGKLGMKDRSKSFIQTALQTIDDPKKREKIVLKYVDEMLVSHALLTAQEMINLELSRLLETKKIKDVIKFCCQFIDKLRESNHRDMIFEYMRYIASLMLQSDHIDYDLLQQFIKDLLSEAEIDRAALILDQLIILQGKQNDFTRAINSISRFVDHLLQNTQRVDLVQKYIFETAEAYRRMGDEQGALEVLVKYQEEVLDYSVELSQKIIDIILKEYEEKEEYKKCITIVTNIIDRQLEQGMFQDAYIFSVQNARYIESSGNISDVIKYLGKMRNRFLEFDQFEDASKMTDLIFRFGKTHQKYKIAIQSIKEYAKITLDNKDFISSIKLALDVAALFKEDGKPDKALEFLHMIFDVTFQHVKEPSLQIFRKIVEIHAEKEDFKKITKKVVDPLLLKYPDVSLLAVVNEVLSPPLDEYIKYSERFYDQLIESSSLTFDSAEGIISLVNLVYGSALVDPGDKLIFKYADKLAEFGFADEAMKLMSILSEKSNLPFTELNNRSLEFVQSLVRKSHIEKAREFTDNLIQHISTNPELSADKNHLGAKVCQKFAHMVARDNPDLASEYAYLAADYLRGANDFDGVVNIYNTLATQYSSSKRAIRIFERGIYICSKFKAKKHEAQLLVLLTKYLCSISNDSVLAAFQQTIEKLEELEDLDELFRNCSEILNVAISTDNLDLVYKYLEYTSKLANMINRSEEMGGSLVFMLNHVSDLKEVEKSNKIREYIDELGIQPKKFKKEFKRLSDERNNFLKSKPLIDRPLIEEDGIAVPTLVDATDLITPVEQPRLDEGIAPEIVEEEIIDVIKGIKAESPLLEHVETPEVVQQPQPQFSPKLEDKATLMAEPQISGEVLEIPPKKEGLDMSATLSDDELSSLFTPAPSSEEVSQVPPSVDDDILSDISQPVKEGVTLSDDEVTTLFSAREDSKIRGADVLRSLSAQESSVSEEEWEVDAFGRLLKKGDTTPSPDKISKPRPTESPSIIEDTTGTPDLSALESTFEPKKEDVVKPTQLKSLQLEPDLESQKTKQLQSLPDLEDLEMALVDTEGIIPPKQEIKAFEETKSLFDKGPTSSFDSVVDALAEDESSDTNEIFGIPEVSYEEISEPQTSKAAEVKPPDLIDLFSDALSELGSITGESGKKSKDKKKKK
ncbi:MAG: hypothetical protein ACXACW_00920 [Candidatus Hodarchaeales archaeon]|jgi:hypothetical protein